MEEDLAHGGQSLLSAEFGVSRNTIRKGKEELEAGLPFSNARIRSEGGGRKKRRG